MTEYTLRDTNTFPNTFLEGNIYKKEKGEKPESGQWSETA